MDASNNTFTNERGTHQTNETINTSSILENRHDTSSDNQSSNEGSHSLQEHNASMLNRDGYRSLLSHSTDYRYTRFNNRESLHAFNSTIQQEQSEKEDYEDSNHDFGNRDEEEDNDSPPSHQDDREDEGGDDEESNFSDTASFPTQEDLESIIVHPPGSVTGDVEIRSVSSIEYGISVYASARSIGSVGSFKERVGSAGGISIGGGGSSVGGMSEKSESKSTFLETADRKFSFTGSDDPSADGKMMIATIPNGIAYAASEMTVKSDAATICSGSVVEDIDMNSVGTVHSGNAHMFVNMNVNVNVNTAERQARRKQHDRGVEFASEPFALWSHGMVSSPTQSGGIRGLSLPVQFRTSTPPNQDVSSGQMLTGSITLNDMGPPLNRTLLERAGSMGLSSMATSMAGSIRSYGSTGTGSRPGSVKSFGSQGASEVVHVDTDDYGGSIIDSDGHLSGGGQEETSNKEGQYIAEGNYHEDDMRISDNHHVEVNCVDESADPSNDINLATLNNRLSSNHGRISPGGTVYKGRGVRRYQGRFMHLPLQRFRQNLNIALPIEGTVIGQDTKSATRDYFTDNREDNWDEERPWRRRSDRSQSRSRSRSRSRDRSRSRERSRGGVHTGSKRVWVRSKSPPAERRQRNLPHNHGNEDWEGRGGNRNQYRSANDHSRWGKRHNAENGRSQNRSRQRNFGSKSRGMTPRDSRHWGSKEK